MWSMRKEPAPGLLQHSYVAQQTRCYEKHCRNRNASQRRKRVGDASDASGDELVQLEHELDEMQGDEPSSCDGESDNADEPQED